MCRRYCRRACVLAAVAGAVVMLADSGALAAQATRIVVSGRVTGAEARPVGGAVVELNGRVRTTTSSDGRFRFADALPGAAEIHVSMIGYEDVTLNLMLRADTTIEIRLTEAAIRLDRIDAIARTITVRGRVTDPLNRLGVAGTVQAQPGGRRDETSFTGRYRITNVPATDSTSITVEAYSYLPQRKYINTMRDTSVDFSMAPDPIVAAMVDRSVERITARSQAIGVKVETLRTKDLDNNGTIHDALRYQHQLREYGCLIWDDDPKVRPWVTPLPHEVELVEIFGRRGTNAEMVRIYTKEYFQRRAGPSAPLSEIVYRRRGTRGPCA